MQSTAVRQNIPRSLLRGSSMDRSCLQTHRLSIDDQVGGHVDAENAALTGLTFHGDFSAVGLGNVFDDCEP